MVGLSRLSPIHQERFTVAWNPVRIKNYTFSQDLTAFTALTDVGSESIHSGLKQAGSTVTHVTTTTTTQVGGRKGTEVQKTEQSTTSREGIMQPQRSLSIFSQAAAGVHRKSFSSTVVAAETQRSVALSESSFDYVHEKLSFMEDSYHQQKAGILELLGGEHQKYKFSREEQFQTIQTENEKLLQQVSASSTRITQLEIQLSFYLDSGSGTASQSDELDSIITTVTTITTTVTTTITGVTTQIERWKDTAARNKGQITISKTDLDQLLSSLSNTSSRMTELLQLYTELSRNSNSVRRELHVALSLHEQKDSTIATLTAQVTRWESADSEKARQMTALREDNDSLRSHITELERRLEQTDDGVSEDLVSLRRELQTKTLLIEERDAEVARLKQSDDEKTRQIATARQDYQNLQRDSSSRIAEFQERLKERSEESNSVRRELQVNKSLVEEKERTIVVLNTEVEKWKRLDATKTEQLDAERQAKQKLQLDFAASSSQKTDLKERWDVQSNEIASLRIEFQTKVSLLAEKEHTITSLTTRLEQAEREHGLNAELLATARKDADQLREKLSVLRDQNADLRKELDAQLTDLGKLRNEFLACGISPDSHIADVSEEKEKKIGELRQALTLATSQNNDLQRSHEALSSELSALRDELTMRTSQYEGTITSLTVQVNQLRTTDAEKTNQIAIALDQVRGLQTEITTSTSEFTTLHTRCTTQSEEITSLNKKLQVMTLSIQERDHDISSLTAERDREMSANAAKAKQIAELQRESSVSTSRLTELRDSCRVHSDELAFVRSELEISLSSNGDKDRKVTTLTNEVAELKRLNILGDERIATARKQVEDLQVDLTKSRSQFAELQRGNSMHSAELDSLREQLEAMESGDNATILSLTAQIKEWKGMCTAKADELTAALRELDQLRLQRESLSSEITELQQVHASQITQWQTLDAAKTAELTAAHEQLKQLRDDLSTSSSQNREYQRSYAAQLDDLRDQVKWCKVSLADKEKELAAARERLEQLQRDLDASFSQNKEYQKSYTVQITELTSQVERWEISHTAKEKELATVRKELEQLQRSCKTHSAELEFFREQLPGISDGSGSSTEDTEEWRTIQTNIKTEVKDYATVINLTTTFDEWLRADAKRAEVLALELERRNKENEELRHKLIVLKEIYIRAPRLKQIFQSETIEVTKLKSALADSQSQLHSVQRFVATADTHPDAAITQMLQKLNAEVQQNTMLIAEIIAKEFRRQETKATKEQLSATQKVSKYLGQNLADYLAHMTDDDDGVVLYLSIAFQAYFTYYLRDIISSWTLKEEHNAFINEMYEQLQQKGKTSNFESHRLSC